MWSSLGILLLCGPAAALQLFGNPFAPPRQAPISLDRQNFALPEHPDLVTLNADPPVYEVPGFLSEAECAELVAAAEAGKFPPIPYGAKNKIFSTMREQTEDNWLLVVNFSEAIAWSSTPGVATERKSAGSKLANSQYFSIHFSA